MNRIDNLRAGLIVIISILGLSIFASVIFQGNTQALQYNFQNTTVSWVDKANILVKWQHSALFTDSNPNDNNKEFVFVDGCGTNKIVVDSKNNSIASITYSFSSNDPAVLVDPNPLPQGQKCGGVQTYNTVQLLATENAVKAAPTNGTSPVTDPGATNPYANGTFNWKNGGQITVSGKNSGIFSATESNKNLFTVDTLTDGETKCHNQISGISADSKSATVKILQNKTVQGGDSCVETGASWPIKIGSVNNQKKTAVYASASQTAPSSTCYANIPIFGVILCPLLDMADGLFSFFYGVIRNLLFIPEATYNTTPELKIAWSSVKNVSTALIVLVGLAMIASQIFSFEFMSAYTVKKVLPRLIIAAILIQLSWFLFTSLIQIFNAIGVGLYSLITQPFAALGVGDILRNVEVQNAVSGTGSQFAGGAIMTTMAAIGLAAGALAVLTPGGWMTLALLAIGVIISLIVAFLTLLLRKMVIILLLVLAPLALVAWILPGTQKYWDAYWKLFIKLLLMFPLIMLLIASGQIFAAIIGATGVAGGQDSGSFVNTGGLELIFMIVAFFAPLFLIGATFKFAGGMFGQAVSFMSNSGKKLGGNPFGLKRRRDAIQKYSDESRARLEAERARDKRGRIMDSGTSFNKLRARASLGAMGFTKRGTSALAEEATIARAKDDKERMDKAALAHHGLVEGLNPKDRLQVQMDALHTQIGGTTRDRHGRDVPVTPELHRQILLDAMTMKNDGLIDAYFTPPAGQTYSDMGDRAEVIRKLSKDGGGEFDRRFTDISRSGTIGAPITYGGALPKVLENFADQSNGRDDSRKRQQEALQALAHLASGNDADNNQPVATKDSTVAQQQESNKRQVSAWLDSLSRQNLRPDAQELIATTLSGSLGMNPEQITDVLRSSGKLQIRYDSSNGAYSVANIEARNNQPQADATNTATEVVIDHDPGEGSGSI